ncbi:MAG TPA: YceI family protein [Mycobacterium sp.]|uniref:YceI family protein n=1 Tax=Mycobacterium sp. TaxID=1785 RepID=UPI002D567B33|nr:YceI family protein [Mycobacterium sp.]HZU46394.1 YceI family protein [Mycobacterium sp.]
MTTLETLLSDPDTAGVWNLVPERSAFTFKTKNFWGLMSVTGGFTDVSGDGQITSKGAVFGRLDIKVASLRTGIRRRDDHLRSPDFFDAERFPEISVVVTALQPTTGNAADLRASLTIKGITAELPLPVTISVLGDGSVRISAKTEVDRAQFGLDWNRAGMIGKAATASADAVFVRAP